MPLAGRYCRLEPLNAARHARDLYEAQREDRAGATLDLFVPRAVRRFRRLREVVSRGAEASRDPQFYAIVDAADRPRLRQLRLHAHRAAPRRHRDRQHLLLAAARAHARRHRGHVPADGERLRAGLSALRMEVRQLQSAVARRGHALRLHLRRPVSPGHRQQGPQSRHHLVRHHRRATGSGGLQDAYLRWLDRGQLRRRRAAEAAAVGAHGAVRGARFARCLAAAGRRASLRRRNADTCLATSSGAFSSRCLS